MVLKPSMERIARSRYVHSVRDWRHVPFAPDEDGPHRLLNADAFIALVERQSRDGVYRADWQRCPAEAQLLLAGRDLSDADVMRLHREGTGRGWIKQFPSAAHQLVAGLVGAGRRELAAVFNTHDCLTGVTEAAAASVMVDAKALESALTFSRGAKDGRAACRAIAVGVYNGLGARHALWVLGMAVSTLAPDRRVGPVLELATTNHRISPDDAAQWRAVVTAYPDLAIEACRVMLVSTPPQPVCRWMLEMGDFSTSQLDSIIEAAAPLDAACLEWVGFARERTALDEDIHNAGPGMSMP